MFFTSAILTKYLAGKGMAVAVVHGGCVKTAVTRAMASLAMKSPSGHLAMTLAGTIMKALSLYNYYAICFTVHGQSTLVTISTKKVVAAILQWRSHNQIKKVLKSHLPAIKQFIKERGIRIHSKKPIDKLFNADVRTVDGGFQQDLKEWMEIQIIDEIFIEFVHFCSMWF